MERLKGQISDCCGAKIEERFYGHYCTKCGKLCQYKLIKK
jgi:hypothetical protein